jgi:hypothetical protein
MAIRSFRVVGLVTRSFLKITRTPLHCRICHFAPVAFVLALAGCGGGVEDPFADRTPVSGTLSLDGEPVQWGGLTLIGQKLEETQEIARDNLIVRDGKFATTEGSPGATPGENQAEVIIYSEDPTPPEDGDLRPKVTGVWSGSVTVKAGEPLVIELKTSDLQRTQPEYPNL